MESLGILSVSFTIKINGREFVMKIKKEIHSSTICPTCEPKKSANFPE